MADLAQENDRLKLENQRLKSLLEDYRAQMQVSVDYWRENYVKVTKVLLSVQGTVRDRQP